MLSTDLGACEWFVWDLRRSNLIDRGHLDQVIGEFLQKNPGAEPPQLAEYLVGQGILTDFQAERLLQGKTQGFVLGPFTLMDALGAGSMGTVYKAQSKTDNKWYAVKVLPRRSMWNVRIARRKVRLFEQCQHPAIVPFVDVGTAGGMHYLAWPLVEGKTLEKAVQEQGKLSVQQAAGWALQAAEGLDAASRAGLFHGMLKPSNLMISPEGQVKILDYGIGCLLAETEGESLVDTMSTANSVNSGLDCASPESIMDPSNLNSVGDQYSLGCVLYFCLTGRYPFPEGTAVEKMMCHQHRNPTPVKELAPDVSEDMVALVERLMQKSPAARFPGTAEVIDALRGLAAAGGAPQRRPTMTMPRVRVPPPPEPGRLSAPPPPPTAPDLTRPTPPRAPSAAAGAKPAPSVQGGLRPAPSAQGGPRPARPSGLGRNPAEPPAAPPARPRPQPKPQPPVREPEYEAEEEYEELAPRGRREGTKYGLVTVVLLALAAGVAAFFLSKMIPM